MSVPITAIQEESPPVLWVIEENSEQMKDGTSKKKRIRKMLSFCLLLFVLQMTTAFAFAENGENDGANRDDPLKLEETDPVYGDEVASLTPTIRLSFSKNVVNFTVKENNSSCFSMTDIKGNPVKISLYFPDDQVEPTEKRNIYITPAEPLKAGTQYVVTVSDKLTAKSGAKPEGVQQLVFRTMKENLQEEKTTEEGTITAPSSSEASPNPLQGEVAAASEDPSVSASAIEEGNSLAEAEAVDEDKNPDEEREKKENSGDIDPWMVLLPIAVLLGAGFLYIRRIKAVRKK